MTTPIKITSNARVDCIDDSGQIAHTKYQFSVKVNNLWEKTVTLKFASPADGALNDITEECLLAMLIDRFNTAPNRDDNRVSLVRQKLNEALYWLTSASF